MYHDVHGLVLNERLGSIPSTFVFIVGTPGVLHHVVLLASLVLGNTVNLHAMVVGSLLVVEGLLTHLLRDVQFRARLLDELLDFILFLLLAQA